jgi:hypothetical protein
VEPVKQAYNNKELYSGRSTICIRSGARMQYRPIRLNGVLKLSERAQFDTLRTARLPGAANSVKFVTLAR